MSKMATIGIFTAGKDGHVGTIAPCDHDCRNIKARIIANEAKTSEDAPDFRVLAGRAAVGTAWKARISGAEPRDYLNVVLDAPSFPESIRAAQFEEEGMAWLIWSRREGQIFTPSLDQFLCELFDMPHKRV